MQRALPLDVSEFASMMHKLSLKVSQRMAYKTTTKRKHSDDLLDQNFNPVIPSQMMISLHEILQPRKTLFGKRLYVTD